MNEAEIKSLEAMSKLLEESAEKEEKQAHSLRQIATELTLLAASNVHKEVV